MTLADVRLDQIKEVVAPPDPLKRKSIAALGVVEPVVVYLNKTGYEVIAGRRRVNEARALGLETIPAIVRDKTSPQDKAQVNLVSNLSRSYNYIDEAGDLAVLLQDFTQQELAARLGVSQGLISQRINLIKKLVPALVEAMRQGRMKIAAARIAQKLSNELQERLAQNEGQITSTMARELLAEQNKDYYDFSAIEIPDLDQTPSGYTLTEADLLALSQGKPIVVIWQERELAIKGEMI